MSDKTPPRLPLAAPPAGPTRLVGSSEFAEIMALAACYMKNQKQQRQQQQQQHPTQQKDHAPERDADGAHPAHQIPSALYTAEGRKAAKSNLVYNILVGSWWHFRAAVAVFVIIYLVNAASHHTISCVNHNRAIWEDDFKCKAAALMSPGMQLVTCETRVRGEYRQCFIYWFHATLADIYAAFVGVYHTVSFAIVGTIALSAAQVVLPFVAARLW